MKRVQICFGFALVLVAAWAPLASPAAAQTFEVTDLGRLGYRYVPLDINDAGQVVGSYYTYSKGVLDRHAFLWQGGRRIDLDGLSGLGSAAYRVNAFGQVVGEASDADARANRAVLWPDAASGASGPIINLGSLDGTWSRAFDINDRGQVVGQTSAGPDRPSRAFLWQDGVMLNLDVKPGVTLWAAQAINNSGLVVGNARLDGMPGNPGFLWDGRRVTLLGFLPGSSYTYPVGINELGQVVGHSFVPDGEHAFLWESGRMIDLGGFAGNVRGRARAINDLGQVVGRLYAGGAGERAFLWDRTRKMRDLNRLIPAGSGWTLESAEGINNRGQIVGVGRFGSEYRAFLLTPRP